MDMRGLKGLEGAPKYGPVRLLAVLLALLPVAQGCVVFGRTQKDHRIEADRVSQVQKGMTKEQVTTILGAPQEIIFSNKEHDPLREHAYVFEYNVQKGTAIVLGLVNFGNLDEKRDRAIVFFGQDDRVINVAHSLRGEQAGYGFPFGR
jgi:outer membrane protein assembly factor BamE (lipoprotein component of BamABCDE complex)